jgi:hypothetical protein
VFFSPGGRPGPGWAGFGALAGEGVFVRRRRNPRRTLAGVSRSMKNTHRATRYDVGKTVTQDAANTSDQQVKG